MKIGITSMFGNPIHRGHIDVLKKSKEHCDFLIVLVDSDDKSIQKKGFSFMPIQDRLEIIKAIQYVDWAIPINCTVAEALEIMKPDCFLKGGDRTIENLPKEEIEVCNRNNIEIICGLGEKIQASSNILESFYQSYKKIKEDNNG